MLPMAHDPNSIPRELRLPDRWLRCPRWGQPIGPDQGTKFLPFKTPLDERYETQIPDEFCFTPSMFIQKWTSQKVPIGMVVDLTNTTRFYDKEVFTAAGIQYLKIKLKGHNEAPAKDQTEVFLNAVEQFIQQNPKKNIGIHCTHGFNRTGFLVCAYLVEKCDWAIDMAVEYYANARPPGIYKKHYLDELFVRYDGSADAAPEAPILPDWCTEGNVIDVPKDEQAGIDSRQKPFVDNEAVNTIFKRDETVVQIFDQPRLGQIQRMVRDLYKTKMQQFIGAQPVSLDRHNTAFLSQRSYHISWKADGTRYILLVRGKDQVYMLDRDNSVFKINNLTFPFRKNMDVHVTDSVFDGEMVIDVDPQSKTEYPRFLIYDALVFQKNLVGQCPFATRILCIQKEIIEARDKAKQMGRINREREPFGVRWKEFRPLSHPRWHKFMAEDFEKMLGHETDGTIFQPSGPEDFYKCGRCKDVLKWKPPKLNTIDFKLKIAKTKAGIGEIARKVGMLYVGDKGGAMRCVDQIPLNRELHALDGKIIECKHNGKHWVLFRERTDKTFPNYKDTALGVWDSLIHPVTKKMLMDYINTKKWKKPVVGEKRPAPTDSHANAPAAQRQRQNGFAQPQLPT